MKTAAVFACALALALVPAASAAADISLPGQKKVRVDADLEFGPFADYAARKITVAEGDTLEKIAQRDLGRSERWREITALNDGLDHKALKVGQVLWIPAVKSTPAGERTEREAPAAPKHWWHFYAAPGGGYFGRTIERIADAQRLPYHHYGTAVFAIRDDVWPTFAKALAKVDEGELGDLIQSWHRQPGFASVEARLAGQDSVSEGSTVQSRLETWRVEGIEGNRISVRKTRTEDRDSNGRVVEGMAGLFGMNGLLLALGFLALSGLVALARRRKASAPIDA